MTISYAYRVHKSRYPRFMNLLYFNLYCFTLKDFCILLLTRNSACQKLRLGEFIPLFYVYVITYPCHSPSGVFSANVITYITVSDEIIYPFLNFICAIVEVWEWISNFIPQFTRLGLLIHARIKAKPRNQRSGLSLVIDFTSLFCIKLPPSSNVLLLNR